MLRTHAFDAVTERRLFSTVIASPDELPRDLGVPGAHFVCLLTWDATGVPVNTVSSLVARLLRAGASYFVCWGADCERVHDIIDETVCDPDSDFGAPADSCIMTTWHDRDPLREALFFFLVNTWPDEPYVDSTRSALAVSIGSPEWAAEIAAALDDPGEFVRRTSEEEDGPGSA